MAITRRAVTRADIDWVVGELHRLRWATPPVSDYPVHWSGSAQLRAIRIALLDEAIGYFKERPLA